MNEKVQSIGLDSELYDLYKELVICDVLDEVGLHDKDNLSYYTECLWDEISDIHDQITELTGEQSPVGCIEILSKEGRAVVENSMNKLYRVLYKKAKSEVYEKLKAVAS